jgi:hypothetical protein
VTDSHPTTAIDEFEAQPTLAPGTVGWWQIWGAGAHHIQPDDIVLAKFGDDVVTIHAVETFPMPVGTRVVDDAGKRWVIGGLQRITLVRKGTQNTLAR